MKRIFVTILALMMALFVFSACNDKDRNATTPPAVPEQTTDDTSKNNTPVAASDVLIAYFSCTGTTKSVAEHIKTKTGGTLFAIEPQVPYTQDDLRYYTNCRADREQADPSARPAIANAVENIDKFDVVFLGYPIWNGQAPKIIYTFLESYDLSGKTIIPFCTSGSSPIGSSATALHGLTSGATWLDGDRFSAGLLKTRWTNG